MSDPNQRIEVEPRTSAVYLLRTAQQHHVQLSAMADQKANILIGASLVILTLSLGQFRNGSLPFALIVLSATAVLAGLFAVLAVMPRTSVGKDQGGYTNPLFFGSFAELSPAEFLARMREVLGSDQSVYHAMAMDFYMIGGVLYRKKYRFLRYSYRSFIVGLLLTLMTLVLELGWPYWGRLA